jgi:hypothetical protein
MVDYAFTESVPGKLTPDGWAAGIWAAAERGDIPAEKPPLMMNDYMGPSLDTTIFATANMIWLFARHPDQWTLLREQPDLMLNAINEVLRIETVIQGFRVRPRTRRSFDHAGRLAVLVCTAQPARDMIPDWRLRHRGPTPRSTSPSAGLPRAREATWPARAPCSAPARVERFRLVEAVPKLNNASTASAPAS